ncbi:hypothetical protein VTN00DRAFT_6598 [Thermoascus crustaceus]|uniref:uncharacterized protein n=1 Tax=Thermoascus crustaceus TaxID=5088 RepID=UPI003743AC07
MPINFDTGQCKIEIRGPRNNGTVVTAGRRRPWRRVEPCHGRGTRTSMAYPSSVNHWGLADTASGLGEQPARAAKSWRRDVPFESMEHPSIVFSRPPAPEDRLVPRAGPSLRTGRALAWFVRSSAMALTYHCL